MLNKYDYWLKEIGVDRLFTDFPGSLHNYQECRTPYPKKGNRGPLAGDDEPAEG
jgi:glycerophosphoryl diester phosphodiesterase